LATLPFLVNDSLTFLVSEDWLEWVFLCQLFLFYLPFIMNFLLFYHLLLDTFRIKVFSHFSRFLRKSLFCLTAFLISDELGAFGIAGHYFAFQVFLEEVLEDVTAFSELLGASFLCQVLTFLRHKADLLRFDIAYERVLAPL